jgi:hypothetical protein
LSYTTVSQSQSITFKQKLPKTGARLDNARELQASWNRSLAMRVPLLAVSMLAQLVALSATSA